MRRKWIFQSLSEDSAPAVAHWDCQGRQPIVVYLPYLAGTADERQYRVMSDREQWFRVIIGQDEVARLITPESMAGVRLPDAISAELVLKLKLDGSIP
jgi:hypothetical protein